MSSRRRALAASALALGLLLYVSPAAAARDRTAPTSPTNLRITATTPTSISLAWNASSDSGTFWYCVQPGSSGCFRVDPPQTFTHPKLAPDRTHVFSVYAIDSAGNRSANSNSVSYTTPPDTAPPSPPPALAATAVHPTRISVSWTASVDATSQVWYTLFVDGVPRGSDLIGYRGTTILHLEPSSTHTFRVTARDALGNTTESNVLSVTTPAATDSTPPTAPANLRFSSETSPPEAWLDWDQSVDDTDPQSLILYEVYLNGVRTDDGVIGGDETVTFCREPGPTTIVLRAVDTSGNTSPPSNEILFSC